MKFTPAELYEENRGKFYNYMELLVKWNKKMNITSLVKPEEIVERHFIDSLSIVPFIVSRETILDIGSGGGFPGIPIKIACPEIKITLVDALKKRCDFMNFVRRSLQLKGLSIICKKVSEKGSVGQFDTIVSRGTLKMDELIRLAIPNLKPGGRIIGMKGFDVQGELNQANPMVREFGLTPFQEILYELPYSGIKRKLIVTRGAPPLFHVKHFS